MSRKPLPVDFNRNAHDKLVRGLARRGFYATTIAAQTGHLLSVGQVRYRIGKSGYSPLAYREGRSQEAQTILRRFDDLIAECRAFRAQVDKGLRKTAKRNR